MDTEALVPFELLPFPREGVRYTYHEPHPFMPKESRDYGVVCGVCGIQGQDRHVYPGRHAFKSYLSYGWRMCVHCGECRVNMQHPDERQQICGVIGLIGRGTTAEDAYKLRLRVSCYMDVERYPEHHHTVRVMVYDEQGREQEGNYVTWRTRPARLEPPATAQ